MTIPETSGDSEIISFMISFLSQALDLDLTRDL